jgi:CheY-like chemotaxis protein
MMKRVLIAEDDPDLRDIFMRTFKKREFDVRVAQDGQEAVDRLREEVPDVLVLDINMPRLSGFDVLAHVRSHRETHDLKVIIITGNTIAVQDEKAKYADLILVKPISIHDLISSTKRLLE